MLVALQHQVVGFIHKGHKHSIISSGKERDSIQSNTFTEMYLFKQFNSSHTALVLKSGSWTSFLFFTTFWKQKHIGNKPSIWWKSMSRLVVSSFYLTHVKGMTVTAWEMSSELIIPSHSIFDPSAAVNNEQVKYDALFCYRLLFSSRNRLTPIYLNALQTNESYISTTPRLLNGR